MAFESGELAAQVIVKQRRESPATIAAQYEAEYTRKFESRLRICGLLRRAAFRPRLASVGIAVCGASEQIRNRIARATRSLERSQSLRAVK